MGVEVYKCTRHTYSDTPTCKNIPVNDSLDGVYPDKLSLVVNGKDMILSYVKAKEGDYFMKEGARSLTKLKYNRRKERFEDRSEQTF